MPKKGQKTVTLNKKTYQKAKDEADAKGKSVAGYVTDLILSNTMEVPALE